MTKFERWVANWLFRRVVRQGDQHRRMAEMFRMLRDAARDEYYEDNLVTVNAVVVECLEEALHG